MFLGCVSAGMLAAHVKTDVYNPLTKEGYQRNLAQGRIKRVAAYYERGGLMPNPLMLNIRDSDMPRVRVDAASLASAFEQARNHGGNWTGSGTLQLPRSLTMWLYDGQHRTAAMVELLANAREQYQNFPVPVAITLGLSRIDEAREFYELNTNAVAVQTDLAWTLLTSLAEGDEALRLSLVERDRDWLIAGEQVVSELDRLDGPWRGRFLNVNTRKQKRDGTLVRRSQFVRSLRPVLEIPLLRGAQPSEIAQLVNAHWLGLADALPEAFADPASYVLQKGTGINTIHALLPQVIEVIRCRGRKLSDPGAHADVLKGLRQLRGYAVVNGTQAEIQGAEFWRANSVAATFSGNSGKRKIRSMVQAVLPAPERNGSIALAA